MDMSFSFDDAAPLALPGLDYAELLATVRGADGVARARETSGPPAPPISSPVLRATLLAEVVLGRAGGRAASLALSGRFADVSDLGGPAHAGAA